GRPTGPASTVPPFNAGRLVIAALHLTDPVTGPKRSPAWVEDYVLASARVVAEAGVPAPGVAILADVFERTTARWWTCRPNTPRRGWRVSARTGSC
ncbi:MAG TPA: hypothetical protein VE033_05160, partial [Acetobacteraceae bacterium]|nr:hypothetical protein [Acetobacteraceae bacterium]